MNNNFLIVASMWIAGCSSATSVFAETTLPIATQHTEADVKSVVAQGVAATVFAGTHVGPGLAYLSETLVKFSSVHAGSVPATATPCPGGGSYTYAWVKSTERAGFVSGDQVNLTYSNCMIGSTVANGHVTLTLKSAATNLSMGDHDFQYEIRFDGYSFGSAGNIGRFSGGGDIISQASKSNSNIQQMTVLAGQNVDVQGDSISAQYKEKCIVYAREYTTPSSQRYGLVGNVDLTRNGVVQSLNVVTRRALIGSKTAAGFVANAGHLDTKNKTLDLSTTAKFSESSVNISADTDRNGSMDLEFVTNWPTLTPP